MTWLFLRGLQIVEVVLLQLVLVSKITNLFDSPRLHHPQSVPRHLQQQMGR